MDVKSQSHPILKLMMGTWRWHWPRQFSSVYYREMISNSSQIYLKLEKSPWSSSQEISVIDRWKWLDNKIEFLHVIVEKDSKNDIVATGYFDFGSMKRYQGINLRQTVNK
jgi:hypothetical protein